MEKMARLIQPLLPLLLICLVVEGFLPRCSHAQTDAPVFSLSCRGASLRGVLGNLATQKGVNLAGLDVIPLTLPLTINLNAVPLEAGLLALLEPKGFTFEKRGEIYFIRQIPPENRRLSLNVSDGKLTIDANMTDVNLVIRTLAEAGISITTAPNLTGQITAHIQDQPLDSALPVLFADFTLQVSDGIYRIAHRGPLQHAGSTILIADGRISMTAGNASLTQLLTELADRAKINLSIVGDIERQITFRLDDRTISEMLTDLAKMTGYTYRQIDDLHFFGKPEIKPDEMNPLIERKTIWLKHLEAQEVLNLLPINIPKQNITVSVTHNTVTIVGSLKLIEETEQFLSELDIANDAIRGRQQKGTIAIDVDSETQRLTVDILNAPIFGVIRQLSIQTGTDVVFLGEGGATQESSAPPSSQVTVRQERRTGASQTQFNLKANTVTLRRTNATLETVLSALFLESSYTYKWVEASPDEKPMLIIGSDLDAPFAEEELIALNYLDVAKVMELLPSTPGVNTTPFPDRNAVLATGTKEKIGVFRKYLKKIDVPQPQAMIQLYLLELTHGNRDELGLTIDIDTAENRTTINIDDNF